MVEELIVCTLEKLLDVVNINYNIGRRADVRLPFDYRVQFGRVVH